MDTELAKTFLMVVETGNFVGAGERLFVSQSTVSARIHALEELLRCTLFVRNKSGATLTPAGRQFQRHATALVRTVELARQDVGIPPGVSGTLVVAGRIGLWETFLLDWLPLMQAQNPRVSIRAESGLEPELMQGIIEGRIDIGVMYTPQSRPGLKVEQLFEERLVMISSDAKSAPDPQPGYVYVDWGAEFYARHKVFFPNFGGPLLTANVGWLALQHILVNGGSGYFPMRIVAQYLKSHRLHIVKDAPGFSMPAYVVFPAERNKEIFGSALELMRNLARSSAKNDAHGSASSPSRRKTLRTAPTA